MRIPVSILFFMAIYQCAVAQNDTTDTISQQAAPRVLDEVVINASYLSREADHILAMPTKEQRRHSLTGYDLLRNLMIPGVSVNRANGDVNTPAGRVPY